MLCQCPIMEIISTSFMFAFAVDAACEKNPFEGAATAPKKTVKAIDSVSSVFGGALDSLSREDISRKITSALLKGLESPSQSIEAVSKIVDEANKRIQPTGTVELFGALRAQLYDSNKNLITATLTSISALASAMGPVVAKANNVNRYRILSDVIKCLGDNKKNTREST
ncbi:putative armadillo-like helical protein [Helianthus annuus]|nr:putative armadillo-like helical protein [Helianthus annuus]KAJ0655715.1 putative armadillo-like helical protein [Helianthus annuus]